MEIWRAQIHISGSPFIVTVSETATSPAQTVLYGSGVYGGSLTGVLRFSVRLHDQYGNARASGGDSVQAVPLDPQVVSAATVTDDADGSYTVVYRGLSAGGFRMRILVNNASIPNSPFRGLISLVPGAPSAAYSLIRSPLPILTVASKEASVLLEVMDGNGAQVSAASASNAVSFSIDAPLGYRIDEPRVEPSPNNAGFFTFVLPSTTRSGTFALHVLVGGAEIGASPFNVTILAAEIDTASCGIRAMTLGADYTTVTAGVAGLFLIDIRDVYSNVVAYDPRVEIGLQADITGPANESVRLIEHYVEGNPGLVEGDYVLTLTGAYVVQVTIAQAPVRGSPFQVVVVPAPVDPASCYAFGAGLAAATPGLPAAFGVQSLDAYGNVADTKGTQLAALLSISSSVADAAYVMPSVASVGYLSGGQYSGQYSVTRSAEYTLSVTFGGVHVRRSPFPVTVQPLDAEPRNVDVQGLGLRKARVGEIASFSVATRDRFGNALTRGGAVFNMSLASGADGLVPSVYDGDDGSYLGFYIARAPGLYNLTLLLRGAHLKGSPFHVEVSLSLPPISVRASFVSGGSVVQVLFDVPTDRGGRAGQADCGVYFANATAARLGAGCVAAWRSSVELQVSLGADASVMVGDDLALRPGLIRNRRQSSYYTFGSIRLGVDLAQAQPFVSVSGPAEVGACDDVLLDARQTNASGGRPLKFRWGIAAGDEVEEAIMARLSALGPSAASVSVGSALLRAGRTFAFSVEAVNFVGGIGRGAFAVAVRAGPVPLVYVEGPRVRPVSPREPVRLRANVSRSACEPTRRIAFQWAVISASDGAPPALANATGRRLYVPAGTFAPGVEYVVEVRAYMADAPERAAAARAVLRATEPPLAFHRRTCLSRPALRSSP